MVPQMGHGAALLALGLAVAQTAAAALGATRARPTWMAAATLAARAHCACLVVAFLTLAWSFATNDFSVRNVAQHSQRDLPVAYRFAATWGSHEGSLLLWTLMLGGWTAAVTWFTRPLPADMVARVLAVMGAISTGFLVFLLFTSNPFLRLSPVPLDGLDLNPLLQDPAMVLHPPLLYMGYVGFSVAFAFGIAALWSRRLDAAWARWSRPWTILAWTFLTCGIALGSFWAYYELGWGGWWFWDPVENASFMPWLLGTALIHSLVVTDKRGAFRSWTVLLAIATFSLSLLGAFLVRSGVLTSVHAFATDPRRGVFLLCFLAIVVGGSLLLYALRAEPAPVSGRFNLISRETLLLSNNVLLAVATGSVLLGTLYPLIVDVLGVGKLSVGPPYFNTVFVAVMAPCMFLLGLGPIARWRRASLPDLAVRLRWAFVTSAAASVAIPLAVGSWKPLVSLGVLLALWIIMTVARQPARDARDGRRLARSADDCPAELLRHATRPRRRCGVHHRDHHRDRLSGRTGCAHGDRRHHRSRGLQLHVPGRAGRHGAELHRGAGGHRGVEERPHGAGLAAGEADLRGGAERHDRDGDRHGPVPRPLRVAGRAPGRGRVAGSRPVQAVRELDLGRRPADGAGRTAGGDRPALCLPALDAARTMKLAIPLCVFAVVSVFLTLGLRLDPRQLPSPLVDRPAPGFHLPQLEDPDARFAPEDMRGRVWLLNVWASWCVSCRVEHPLLTALSDSGVVPIYGLAYKDQPDDARRFLARFGNPYVLSVLDLDGRTGIDYGVYGAPETYLIDKRGVVRFKQVGPLTVDVIEDTILPMVGRLR